MMRRSTATVSLGLLFALATPGWAQLSPEKALESLTVAEGLQVELFASEPMFVNPTCIDIDHKGRVWVCESVNYRTQLHKKPVNRKEGDRLVVLEDTDADGKADRAVTFYQAPDFIAPLGVAVAPEPDGKSLKVYVCHSPHIYVFEDKDGDLKADGPPKILLTGFRGYDHDHGVHGIHIGPDGKLYFSVGDQGLQNLSSSNGDIKPDKETRRQVDKGRVWNSNSTDCRAGTIWRCNLDGTNLELLAHNFRNPYEPAVDSFGTLFTSDNDDDGNQQTRICYVMPGGNYGYHPRGPGQSHWHEEQPGVVHKVLRTGFGSPTGMCWSEGTLLHRAFIATAGADRTNRTDGTDRPQESHRSQPGDYGYLLHTDAGPREVRCFHVKTKGAGYELQQQNLLSSSDNWFRPSDVCVAPDGSVMVSDWYDPGVGGHGMGDTTRGRIYRITPKGHKGYKVPIVDVSKPRGVVAALGSPNLATRHVAVTVFADHLKDKTDSPSFGIDPESPDDPWTLMRKLWLFCQTDAECTVKVFLKWKNLEDALQKREKGPDPVGAFFVRSVKDKLLQLSKASEETLSLLLSSRSAEGRRELLLALRDDETEFARKHVWPLVKHYSGHDPFYLAAIGIAVGNDPKRREIILADFEKHFPEWNDAVADLVWELRPPQVIAKLGDLLGDKFNDPKLTASQKARIIDILAVTEQNDAGVTLLKLLSSGDAPEELRQAAIKNLRTHLPGKWKPLQKSPELKAAVEKLLAVKATREQAVELIAAGQMVQSVDQLAAIARNDDDSPTARTAAVRALGELKTDEAVKALVSLIPVEFVRREAIQALGKVGSPAALQPLQGLVKDEKQPLEVREDAVAGLAGSRQGSVWLLDAHARKELPPPLAAEAGFVLRNSPFQDLRNKALAAFPPVAKIDPKKRIDPNSLPRLRSLVSAKGDVKRGHTLFHTHKDLGCVRCHSVHGIGGAIGPDLSLIGKKASRENLFESVLFPDRAIADQFIQWAVDCKDGTLLLGLLVEETPDHIVIRDALGKDAKVLKKDINDKVRSPKSIMPADLLAYMTEQDLVDLTEYVQTLRSPLYQLDYWYVLGPFDNTNGAGFDAVYPPEQKVELDKQQKGKRGQIRWRTWQPEPTGYVNLHAFHNFNADATVNYAYREFESQGDQEATIHLGTDDGCKLWVNGQLVFSIKKPRGAVRSDDMVKVKLKNGVNTILLKVENVAGAHGFYLGVAAEQPLAYPKLAGFRIDEWHVIGPFDNNPNNAGLDKPFPPEEKIDLAGKYPGKAGEVVWKRVRTLPTGLVDLKAFLDPHSEHTVSYVYREIESPAAQDAVILLGTDDMCKLWLNGQLVHQHRIGRGAQPADDLVKVKLNAGKNTILLKVNNGTSAHGFYFTMNAEQALRLLPIK